MSPKQNASVSATIDLYCQHISPKGRRCHMLIDENHRPANGARRSTLCAYHANRLRVSVPAVDPEVLAAELLDNIDSFTTADEVNLFLGNLVRQLARKRISRRDAIALAYLAQLLLNSLRAMERQAEAERNLEDLSRFLLRRSPAPQAEQPSGGSATPSDPDPRVTSMRSPEQALRST